MAATVVGRVAEIRRFPVKSMAGELLEVAEIGWTGLHGDRQYAFVRAGDGSHFPWFTGRQWPGLLLHRARYAGNRVEVRTPHGQVHDVTDPALRAALEHASGHALAPMRLSRGCYDAMPVSLLSTSLLRTLGAAHGHVPEPLRFRANILIEAADGTDERAWTGRTLTLGSLRLCATYPTGRCAMINIDPGAAIRDPPMLRTVAQHFGGTAGLYAAVAAPGKVAVGDEVRVADP